jgi:hypothetical protein
LVSHVTVTDVTPKSFSVVWASSEASTPDLQIYADPEGQVLATGVVIRPQPIRGSDNTIGILAEDNGVMKVMVSNLMLDTTYYFRTVTTSKSTSDVTYQPDNTPLPSCTTETRVIRTRSCAEDKTYFSNDLVIFESYLPGSSTPAAGTLVLAEVEGCSYPLSSFVGDGVAAPMTIIDLNNLFSYPGFYTKFIFGNLTRAVILSHKSHQGGLNLEPISLGTSTFLSIS